MKITKAKTLILFFTCFFFNIVYAQRVEPENMLLWRISSPDNAQDSYIYGTMHVNDARVFNFSDSVYVKIEECKYFALEVHPDTIVKHLIIDPFNNQINASFETEFDEEEDLLLEDFKKDVKKDIDIDLSFFSRESLELLPLLKDKIFRKNKDKNTFLDAHLYHIAKLLDKDIVGLESMEDQFRTLNKIKLSKDLELPDFIKIQKERKNQYNQLLETYVSGNVDKLYNNGGYVNDSILAYRNHVMTDRSLQYINDGGIFMAVGAAHLSGEEGILNLLKLEGYNVSPVKAIFSKKMLKSELSERKLEWVTEDYPLEGFKISLPDKAYDYRPESMGGLMEVRTYPDLGGGHFFFYSSVPIMVDNFTLKTVEDELRKNAKIRGAKISKKNIKYGSYQGQPSLDINLAIFNQKIKFRYIKNNNYLLILGITPMNKATVEEDVLKRFYNSVELKQIKANENGSFTSEKGAFSVLSDARPQTYKLYDEGYGYKTTLEYNNFFDQENNLMNMVVYSYDENGIIYDDVDLTLDNIEDFFVSEGDSLISVENNQRFGGKKIFVSFDDGTFLKGLLFVRGNRFYQVVSTGNSDEKNFKKADSFIDNFDIISYKEHSLETFKQNEFSSQFFNKPIVDSNAVLWYSDHESEAIKYVSFDVNSGATYWVKKKKINPYSTYESIDSCFSAFTKLFEYTGNSIVNSSCNENPNSLEMLFQLRNESNQLDQQFKLIFDGENIYELCLIQDTSSMDIDFHETFVSSFKLNQTPKKSDLLRDSSMIYNLIFKDLSEADTIIQSNASNMLSVFNFNEIQNSIITENYMGNLDFSSNVYFNNNMIRYIFENNNQAIEKYLIENYGKIKSDEINKTIFQLFLERLEEKDIDIIKSFVSIEKPKFEYTWELNNILSSHYHQQEKLKPLIPTLIDLGKTDTTFTLNGFFVDLLRNDIISYEDDLSSISSFIEDKTLKLYKEVKNDDSGYSLEYSLKEYASLSSFGDCREELLEVYEHIYKDTSYSYYQLNGAEALLRCNENVDLSEFCSTELDKSIIMQLYGMQREFPSKSILPDSLLTFDKYIIHAGLDYVEQEEYYDSIEISEIEEVIGSKKTEYFYTCTLKYEGDEEVYPILVLLVLENEDVQKKPFKIPDYKKVKCIYEYMEDEDKIANTKEVLRGYIKDGYGY